MKTHKWIIIFMALICVASILIAVIFNKICIEFWSNIFIGIFSSGLLALIFSIINYRTERKKTLEEFYTNVKKVLCNFGKYQYGDDPIYAMEAILKMNEFDYTALDFSYGNIDFIFTNGSSRVYIYEAIYKRIVDLRNRIAEKSFHFMEYMKAKNGNLHVMELFIKEIDKEIMSREYKVISNEDGSTCRVSSSHNKFIKEIDDEINGRYFKIMYGRKAYIE